MEKIKINIATDFGTKPGARFKSLGEFSGQAFYEDLLLPKYNAAVAQNTRLVVALDGVRSYPYSFLDESFGKLAREYGLLKVAGVIEFEASEKRWVIDYIKNEVWKNNEAN